MRPRAMLCFTLATATLLCVGSAAVFAQPTPAVPIKIAVDWKSAPQPLRTTATLQVVVNPLLRRGSPIHDAAFANLKELGADYVRYVPWLPYPRLAVAELEPPASGTTSWDFSLIDPMTTDFLRATRGHTVILNFSTIPAWMYQTAKPVEYPKDPDKVVWNYTQGSQLRDPSRNELAGYYERLVSWYTKGGFTDEAGKRHTSGHHFNIAYWEVFNEADMEHRPSPAEYTANYDAIVERLHKLNPSMKFVGLALALPERNPAMFEYFLNHANHKPGIPLDMISYHFYATPAREQNPDNWQYSFFDQADKFIVAAQHIDAIRKRLSPATKVDMDEVGSILPADGHTDAPYAAEPPIPPVYWQASGALYAYVYLEAAKLGIDVVGESQLVGYPSQYPSVTLLDWTTGKPNARFEVLRLLRENLTPGDVLNKTKFAGSDVDAQAFSGSAGRRLLLINKRNRSIAVGIPAEFAGGRIASSQGDSPASPGSGDTVTLPPFAVVLVHQR